MASSDSNSGVLPPGKRGLSDSSEWGPEEVQLKRAFRAHMRHQLRTPINAIIGYSELLIEDAEELGYQAFVADIEKILAAGRLLLALVTELLDSTQNESMASLDIEEFAARVGHGLRTPITTVDGYCDMLIEEAQQRDDLDELIADLEKIRRAARRMLALIGEIVEMARVEAGDRTVDSEFTTDARTSSEFLEVIANIQASSEMVSVASGGTLLVVDDNETNRQMLARRLVRRGYQVDAAEDGPQAIQMLRSQRFDLVLLDIVMPGMDGLQVLKLMKADEELCHVPVIMLSSLDEVDGVVACIETGADDYLTKPFDPVLLQARIGACLEKKRLRDREQAYLEQLQIERDRSERLLLNVLPEPIAERLKRSEGIIVDHFPEVTVLFADLVGFTPLTAILPPAEMIGHLNAIFSAFDQLVAELDLEKVKTIGDAYMVAGGMLVDNPDHAAAMAHLALAMMDEIGRISASRGRRFQLRVGLATGPVVGGVIGTSKFIYDLWGDAVNTAARMESQGIAGRVQVSPSTYRLLQGRFCFEGRGVVEIKGKGEMETFLLLGAVSSPS